MRATALPVPLVESHTRDLELARRSLVDAAARDELFRKHLDAVHGLVVRLLGGGHDAEDVVQETFIEVFRSIDRFRGQAALGSWIHRITVRTALRYRKRVRRSRAQLAVLGAEEPAAPTTTGEPIDRARALSRVYELLGRLNEERRAAFILHEVEQRSLAETAALLGISVTAAKKKAARAREQLERWARADDRLAALFEDPGGRS